MVTTTNRTRQSTADRKPRPVVWGGELCAGSRLGPWLNVAVGLIERFNAAKKAIDDEVNPAARLGHITQAAGILDDIDTLRRTLRALTGASPFEFPGIKVARHGLVRARHDCMAAIARAETGR